VGCVDPVGLVGVERGASEDVVGHGDWELEVMLSCYVGHEDCGDSGESDSGEHQDGKDCFNHVIILAHDWGNLPPSIVPCL